MKQIVESIFNSKNIVADVSSFKEDKLTIHLELGEGWVKNTINKEENTLFLHVWDSSGNTVFDILKKHEKQPPSEKQELFYTLTEVWNAIIEQDNNIRSIFLKGDVGFDFGHQSFTRLKDLKFHHLNLEQQKLIGWIYPNKSKYDWIKVTHPDNPFINFSAIWEEIINAFIQIQSTKDITLEFDWNFEKEFLNIYYQGSEQKMKICRDNDSCVISFDNHIFVIKDLQDIAISIEAILETLRLQNKPNRKRFDCFCNDVLYMSNEPLRNSFHSLLLSNDFTEQEIEEYAVKCLSNMIQKKDHYLYDEDMKLISYLNSYIFLNLKTKEFLLFKKEQELEAKEIYKESVLEAKETKLDSKINNFS